MEMRQVGNRRSLMIWALGALLGVSAAPLVLAQGEALPVLTLDQCVSIALQDSPTLQIAESRRQLAAKDVLSAKGAFLPDLSLSYTWQKSERTDFDLPQYTAAVDSLLTYDSAGDYTLWQSQYAVPAGVDDETINTKYKVLSGRATLNLFSGFSKWSGLSSARHGLQAAEASRDYTGELVVQDVITAYYNLLRYEKLLEVAIDTREQAAKELERTETYFRLGSAAKSDVLQQRVRLENTRLDLVVAQNTVKMAFADLAYLMNRPLAAEFRVDTSELSVEYGIDDLETLYAEALAGRLDLRSSEESLAARRNDVITATSGLYPSLNLFANHSRTIDESPYKFGSQKSANTSFGYSVSWNIFDRLQTVSGRGRAQANARIAEYELQQARMNVQVEIRQLHNSQVEARERAAVSRGTIEQSAEELRLAQERFRVGAGTTLDVITAQVNLASSRAQEVQAMCDFLIARAKLNRAAGRPNPWTGGRG